MDAQVTKIPETFVPLNYTNDPETEDLIFGDELREGMVALCEDPLVRPNPDRYESAGPHEQIRILEGARWARIASIRRRGDILSVICEYHDGSKSARTMNVSFAWFVKKSSIPS